MSQSQDTNAPQDSQEMEGGKTRKVRFTFTIDRDIFMMKALLNANPWEYGDHNWMDVVNTFKSRGWDVTTISLKNRLKILLKMKKSEDLPKTGTEEQKTERGELLSEIEALMDASLAMREVPIHVYIGANEIPAIDDNEDTTEHQIHEQGTDEPETRFIQTKRTLMTDRVTADNERDLALDRMPDEPPLPIGTRKKRSRMLEEDLIEKRQIHEIRMEEKRFKLEEDREKRLEEEGQRKDDIALRQINLQEQQLEKVK